MSALKLVLENLQEIVIPHDVEVQIWLIFPNLIGSLKSMLYPISFAVVVLACSSMLRESPIFLCDFHSSPSHKNGIFLTFQIQNFPESSDNAGYVQMSALKSVFEKFQETVIPYGMEVQIWFIFPNWIGPLKSMLYPRSSGVGRTLDSSRMC